MEIVERLHQVAVVRGLVDGTVEAAIERNHQRRVVRRGIEFQLTAIEHRGFGRGRRAAKRAAEPSRISRIE